MHLTAGSGGQGINATDPSYANGANGGNAGSLTIVRPPGSSGNTFATDGALKLDIGGGIGGGGDNGCGGWAGGSGGNGGALHDGGLMPFITTLDFNAFNGGSSGGGSPPGTAGIGGSNDEGTQVGVNGATGSPC
jgi:hypothetical protein